MELSVPVSDEVALHVRHREGAGSRPYVLLDGLACNARIWDEVAARLAAAGHPVYAVDLRGHGESDVPPDGYDSATIVADLLAVSNALGLSGPLFAGHCWGGHVALRMAAEHPSSVAGLALIDAGYVDLGEAGGATDLMTAESFEAAMLRNIDWTSTAEELRRYLRNIHSTWTESAREAHVTGSMRLRPDGKLVPRLPRDVLFEITHGLREEPPSRWYADVHVPVMLLPASSAARARSAAGSRADSGHGIRSLSGTMHADFPGARSLRGRWG